MIKVLSIIAILIKIIPSSFCIDERVQVPIKESSLTKGHYFKSYDKEEEVWFCSETFLVEYHSARLKLSSFSSFLHANIFNINAGEVALYPGNVDKEKIGYNAKRFNDFEGEAAEYLSTLTYEYVPAENSFPAFLIITYVDTPQAYTNRGYSQTCLQYFMTQFVEKHTYINYVVSDLRHHACRSFFPKFNFKEGLPETLKGAKKDVMTHPYFWERSSDNIHIKDPSATALPAVGQWEQIPVHKRDPGRIDRPDGPQTLADD
jgi:hypothetical protein